MHTYPVGQRRALILEVIDLEALAVDKAYEIAFASGPLKLRGAHDAPIRPPAIPIR